MVNKWTHYRFRFSYNSIVFGNVDQVITPRYDRKMLLVTEEVPDEYFYRTKNTFKFTVTRENYELLKLAPFDEDLTITLQSNHNNVGWLDKWVGTFNYTDYEVDEDQKTIQFVAETQDLYKDILDNWDKEINLLDLDIPKEEIEFTEKGLIQFYVLGSNVITNHTVNGTWSEQRVDNPTQNSADLAINHFFSPITSLNPISKTWISGTGSVTPDITGYYPNLNYGIDVDNASRVFLVNDTTVNDFDDYRAIYDVGGVLYALTGYNVVQGQKYVYFFRTGVSNGAPSTGTLTHVSGGVSTADISYQSTETVLEGEGIRKVILATGSAIPIFIGATYRSLPFSLNIPTGETLQSVNNNDKCSLHATVIVTRVLTNQETITGQTVHTLPDDDIVTSNYKYALRPSDFDGFYNSDLHSTTNQQFGKYDEDAPNFASEYYQRPTSPTGLIPINESTWRYASLWAKPTAELIGMAGLAGTQRTTTAYRLSNVIKALLGEFSTVTHEHDINHSTFLYGEGNPISIEFNKDIYITPKSNVTKNGYDFAASKANIKFKELMTAVKLMLNSGWHIDDSNRFRLEHALWYWYGGENTIEKLSYDLTSLYLPKNAKAWSFGTNKYTFEKNKIPSESAFKWMDESSPVFTGVPIKNTSKYVEKSLVNSKSVSIFSSDIDSMISSPEDFSKNGFAIFNIDDLGGTKQIASEWLTFKGVNIYVQNGRFTFHYIHDKFYRKPSKSERGIINGTDFFQGTTERNKIQNINFPLSLPNFDPISLIKTNLGDGKIVSLSENIITHEVILKLRHETKK